MPCANGIWSVGGRNWNEDFEMLADDCNCTGHFGVDAFCLALHGADLHIWSGAWSAQHGKQAKRIYARYYLGMRVSEIAAAEGVDPSRVRDSIRRGLKQLAKYF